MKEFRHIFRLTILFLLMFLMFSCDKNPVVTTEKGKLDLSSCNFEQELYEINGDIEFYWNEFYSSADLNNDSILPDAYPNMISVWKNIEINNEKLPAFGYATYRLILKTNSKSQKVSLYIPSLSTAYKIYLNDKLICKSGNPAKTPENHISNRERKVIDFELDSNYNELIFHVSNFDFKNGGFWYSVNIGKHEKIRKKHEYIFFSDTFSGAIFFLSFVLSLSLFAFRKKKQNSRTFVYFSLFIFFVFLRTLFTNSLIIEHFIEVFPYKLAKQFEYISMTGIGFSFIMFLKNLYPKATIKILNYLFIAFPIIYSCVIIFGSLYVFSSNLIYFQILFLGGMLYSLFVIIRATIQKYSTAKYFLFGYLFLLVSGFTDVLTANGVLPLSFYTISFAILIFIIALTIIMIFQIIQVEKDKTNLESSLQTLNQLNEIGLEIIANLEIEEVLGVVNKKINSLIPIDNLAIGLYNKEKKQLQFIGVNKNGEIKKGTDFISNKQQLSVFCFRNNEKIFISDFTNEYINYMPELKIHKNSEMMHSLIYIPLIVKDKKIGVLTIQSKEKNAFTEFDLLTIENIGLFASIAMENANVYEKINKQERELETILDTANEGIGMLSKRGYFTYVNNSLCRILGYSRDEFVKNHYLTFMVNKNDMQSLDVRGFLKGKIDVLTSENQFLRKDGTKIWGKLSIRPIIKDSGKIEQIVGVFTDINQLKLSELDTKRANRKITSSINYAQKIQKALMPSKNLIKSLFPKSFILFEPKDIVSGDFYFAKKLKNRILLAIGDCTGHGVPGAMMSMLGISILNEIIRKTEIKNAAEVLNELRENVKTTLRQKGERTDQLDGMDITFIDIDTNTNIINFSGANSPLVIFRNNELIEIKGDSMPIAIFRFETPFTNHKIELQKNDIIYMYSDGYQTQLGNGRNEKFTTKRFKKLLKEIHKKDCSEQKKVLKYELRQWQGAGKQTDDILVFGFKVV